MREEEKPLLLSVGGLNMPDLCSIININEDMSRRYRIQRAGRDAHESDAAQTPDERRGHQVSIHHACDYGEVEQG